MEIVKAPAPRLLVPDAKAEIERKAFAAFLRFVADRQGSVDRGHETPVLAALLVDKFGEGMLITLAGVVGVDTALRGEVDRQVRQLDPNFEASRASRLAARPAGLALPSPGAAAAAQAASPQSSPTRIDPSLLLLTSAAEAAALGKHQ